MMKELKVKNISESDANNCIEQISGLLDTMNRHRLEYEPWPEFSDKPKVGFTIAYDLSSIFLKFYVEEKHIRAENKIINSPVHEDSCVEFFVSFDEGLHYYNIEFNCIGTGFIGYGATKLNRQVLDKSLVNNLKQQSSITLEQGKTARWELTIAIPLDTFIHTPVKKLKEVGCRANFYKCGDQLPEPHFIAWSNIIADKPNFHLPEYFGRLIFE